MEQLLERQKHKCAYCPMKLTLDTATIDHVISQHRAMVIGRPELIRDINNLVAACETCNNRKGNKNTVPPSSVKAEQMVGLQVLKQKLTEA